MKTLPRGLWPVMLTPFCDDGAIDWNALDALTEWYLAHGSAGLFACCLSSEMYHLTEEERLALVRQVVKQCAGRAPVVATGTFGGPIEAQADYIKRMADTGVAAVVVMPNQLVADDEDEALLRERLEWLMAATEPVSLGFYECPSPYKRLLSAELIRWAAPSGRFLYLKDTTCDPAAIQAKLAALQGTPLRLYNANTHSALPSLYDGAAGLSPIAANWHPELFAWLCAYFHDRPVEAHNLQRMLRLMEAVVSIQYPASAKLFLQGRGLPIQPGCRSMKLRLSYDLQSMFASLAETVDRLRLQLEIE
jgi:4-hydroxy-tetrahydrodipicolinate synthase